MFIAQRLPYSQTRAFAKIVLDYLQEKEALKSFYSFSSTPDGIKQAIERRSSQVVDRNLLVNVLRSQYSGAQKVSNVTENIDLLQRVNTFTVCTAHQPNLFTGPLYFIYKILHAIKLAAYLKKTFPQYHFVPVFYMGCEDADLQELNHFTVHGKKYVWRTDQKGAVGRMRIDDKLVALIGELEQQISVEPFGSEWIQLLRKIFTPEKNILTATFELLHDLFGRYGLVVLVPDNTDLKRAVIPVFEEDIFEHKALQIVSKTSEKLARSYKVQANAREINLFYLRDNVRARIEKRNSKFEVLNTEFSFSAEELKKELHEHAGRFSPNVILRGLLQETILPNIAFVGGGGEVAYWLQLKSLFDYYNIPFPVLVLRNSFLIIEKRLQELMDKLQLIDEDLFQAETNILNNIIDRKGKKPELNGETDDLQLIYDQLKSVAASYDVTLSEHVEALKTRTLNQLDSLQKKMLRAERKKHEATKRQITKLKQQLFPDSLQERTENIANYYSKWGRKFIDELYDSSLALEQEFVILHQKS